MTYSKSNSIVFPELRQTYTYDCGVSCLQAVLAYYGIQIRESELLESLNAVETDIFDNGVRMKSINDYALSQGLESIIEGELTIILI